MATEGIHPTFRGGEGRGGGANSPYAQALLETTTGNREDKREFDERLELFKTAMALQREDKMQEHQRMIEAHQLAMEQHQMRMEQVAMERERINAEKTERKEADDNKRELIGLRIQNELDPSSLNYTQKRAELMKDPDVLSAITGTQGAAVYKLLKDSDKEHKDHATYWQTVLKDNHVQGDYRNPNVIPQDEDGKPVWTDDFQKRLQQGNIEFQRAEAQRPLSFTERKQMDQANEADWKRFAGDLPYSYAQATLNSKNPKGVTATSGFVNPNTGEFKADPQGDKVVYKDATKKGGFTSSPVDRDIHEQFNTSIQRTRGKASATMEEFGVQATPGVMSIEDPVQQKAPEKSINLGSFSFGVAPQAGMNVETTGNVPLPTQGSQDTTKFAGGQAAPFAKTQAGEFKSSGDATTSATEEPTQSAPKTEPKQESAPSAPKPEPKAGEMTLPDTIPGTQWPFNGRYERKQARAKAEKEGSTYVDPFPGFPEM
jgi:hypothetical protein